MVSLFDEKALQNEETERNFERIIYEIKVHNTAEIKCDWSDLLCYVLLFKKLNDIHKENYRV